MVCWTDSKAFLSSAYAELTRSKPKSFFFQDTIQIVVERRIVFLEPRRGPT